MELKATVAARWHVTDRVQQVEEAVRFDIED